MATKKRAKASGPMTYADVFGRKTAPVGELAMDLLEAAHHAAQASTMPTREKVLVTDICARLAQMLQTPAGVGPLTSDMLCRAHAALADPQAWNDADREAHAVRLIGMLLPPFRGLKDESERRTEAFRIAAQLRPFVADGITDAPVGELVQLFDSFEPASKGKRGKRNASALYAELLHRFGAAGVDSWGKAYADPKAIRRRTEMRLKRRSRL